MTTLTDIVNRHAAGEYAATFKKKNIGSVVNVAIIGSSPGEDYYQSGACHLFAQYELAARPFRGVDNLALITFSKVDHSKKSGLVEYFDWLLNKSPVSDAYVTKDPITALKFGVIQSVDVHPDLFLVAAQLCRWPWNEYSSFVNSFDSLIQEGYDIPYLLQLYLVIESGLIVAGNKWLYTVPKLGTAGATAHMPFWNINLKRALLSFCSKEKLSGQRVHVNLDEDKTIQSSRWSGSSNKIWFKNVADLEGESSTLFKYLYSGETLVGSRSLAKVDVYTSLWKEAIPLTSTGKGVDLKLFESEIKKLGLSK